MNKYYLHEFRPGLWHILERGTNVPVHGREPDGKDTPLVFLNPEAAEHYAQNLNEQPKPKETQQ